jgi:hypothetical protein
MPKPIRSIFVNGLPALSRRTVAHAAAAHFSVSYQFLRRQADEGFSDNRKPRTQAQRVG